MSLSRCPGCGATWSCDGSCPIGGYNGTGWRLTSGKVEEMMNERLKQLAQETMSVQDACNLSGVAQRFASLVIEVRQMLNLGTDETNKHPLIICWLDKMNSLAGIQDCTNDDDGAINRAHRQVQDWAK